MRINFTLEKELIQTMTAVFSSYETIEAVLTLFLDETHETIGFNITADGGKTFSTSAFYNRLFRVQTTFAVNITGFPVADLRKIACVEASISPQEVSFKTISGEPLALFEAAPIPEQASLALPMQLEEGESFFAALGGCVLVMRHGVKEGPPIGYRHDSGVIITCIPEDKSIGMLTDSITAQMVFSTITPTEHRLKRTAMFISPYAIEAAYGIGLPAWRNAEEFPRFYYNLWDETKIITVAETDKIIWMTHAFTVPDLPCSSRMAEQFIQSQNTGSPLFVTRLGTGYFEKLLSAVENLLEKENPEYRQRFKRIKGTPYLSGDDFDITLSFSKPSEEGGDSTKQHLRFKFSQFVIASAVMRDDANVEMMCFGGGEALSDRKIAVITDGVSKLAVEAKDLPSGEVV